MRVGAAQFRPIPGQIHENLTIHEELIRQAATNNVDLLLFPELSLTGYEPTLANSLAIDRTDPVISGLETISEQSQVAFGVGVPLRSESGVQIGHIFVFPDQETVFYSKQRLHESETSAFVPGSTQLRFSFKNRLCAPAICYESTLPDHIETLLAQPSDIFLVSVVKHEQGLVKARQIYQSIARERQITVVMSNALGPADDFIAAGHSAIWNSRGVEVRHAGLSDKTVIWIDTKKEGHVG